MTSAPIVAMVLAKENAIQQWRELIGPTNSNVAKETHPDRFLDSKFLIIKSFVVVFLNSIRALFGTNEQKNAVHGSDSAVSAEREIRFFFPNCKLK
jgi:nucleoside-diphosphate kinase